MAYDDSSDGFGSSAAYENSASSEGFGSHASHARHGRPEGCGDPGGAYDSVETYGSGGSEGFPVALKVLVAGGFGVGKTTFVGAVSEIAPLSTEELLTQVSAATDSLDGIESKTSTTVAMDFGRITLDEQHVLYLFGTPGQERFWFMWDELSQGALGAVVIADTRRLAECFAAVDFFERRGIGFIVAVNEFDGAYRYAPEEVRAALDLGPDVPVVLCDARIASSGTGTLVTLVQHLINATSAPAPLSGFGAHP
ncbi:ATP/GTP-binding protein [Streptomyces sp. NPDC056638]|uniref:GTP-binding protein n=1 Tax=Streptomyces sp. NPDC056638 TaxID=3345887 RepID=UPI00367AB81F